MQTHGDHSSCGASDDALSVWAGPPTSPTKLILSKTRPAFMGQPMTSVHVSALIGSGYPILILTEDEPVQIGENVSGLLASLIDGLRAGTSPANASPTNAE